MFPLQAASAAALSSYWTTTPIVALAQRRDHFGSVFASGATFALPLVSQHIPMCDVPAPPPARSNHFSLPAAPTTRTANRGGFGSCRGLGEESTGPEYEVNNPVLTTNLCPPSSQLRFTCVYIMSTELSGFTNSTFPRERWSLTFRGGSVYT